MFQMDENRILIDPLEIDSIPFHNNHFQCSDEENLNKTFIEFKSDGASLYTRLRLDSLVLLFTIFLFSCSFAQSTSSFRYRSSQTKLGAETEIIFQRCC